MKRGSIKEGLAVQRVCAEVSISRAYAHNPKRLS